MSTAEVLPNIVQFSLAWVLFYVANWLGGHSYSSGYRQITLLEDPLDAPAFNVVFRVLAPVVFLVLTAAMLYAAGLPTLVRHYWFVTVYYFVIRWGYNVVNGRTELVNWGRQFALGTVTIALSALAYRVVLRDRSLLLPDPKQLRDQLWILIILFVYQTLNGLALGSADVSGKRREKYIADRYSKYQLRFHSVVKVESHSRVVEVLSYATMIYESYNRPPILQTAEFYLLGPLGLARSFGPMQVQAEGRLAAAESVRQGVAMLRESFLTSLQQALSSRSEDAGDTAQSTTPTDAQPKPPELERGSSRPDAKAALDELSLYERRNVLEAAARRYNVRSDYPNRIMSVFDVIAKEFYPDIAASFTYGD